MGIKKRKEAKKKRLKAIAKNRVIRKRKELRGKVKKDRDTARVERETRERLMPYIKPEKKDEKIKEQLEHNMQLLKALEEEFNKTEEKRKALNDDLERDGNLTLKDKLDALEEKKNETLGIEENYKYDELLENNSK